MTRHRCGVIDVTSLTYVKSDHRRSISILFGFQYEKTIQISTMGDLSPSKFRRKIGDRQRQMP